MAKDNDVTMFKVRSIELEVFKSLLVVFLSALLAVIGYAGVNWFELSDFQKILTAVAFICLLVAVAVWAVVIFRMIIKLSKEVKADDK